MKFQKEKMLNYTKIEVAGRVLISLTGYGDMNLKISKKKCWKKM